MDYKAKTPVWQRAEIASPCVQICVIHPRERICAGCYRTIDEITDWSKLSDAERRQLIEELPERAERLKKRRGGRRRK